MAIIDEVRFSDTLTLAMTADRRANAIGKETDRIKNGDRFMLMLMNQAMAMYPNGAEVAGEGVNRSLEVKEYTDEEQGIGWNRHLKGLRIDKTGVHIGGEQKVLNSTTVRIAETILQHGVAMHNWKTGVDKEYKSRPSVPLCSEEEAMLRVMTECALDKNIQGKVQEITDERGRPVMIIKPKNKSHWGSADGGNSIYMLCQKGFFRVTVEGLGFYINSDGHGRFEVDRERDFKRAITEINDLSPAVLDTYLPSGTLLTPKLSDTPELKELKLKQRGIEVEGQRRRGEEAEKLGKEGINFFDETKSVIGMDNAGSYYIDLGQINSKM